RSVHMLSMHEQRPGAGADSSQATTESEGAPHRVGKHGSFQPQSSSCWQGSPLQAGSDEALGAGGGDGAGGSRMAGTITTEDPLA
ncbi:MAG: hypothetical protein U1E22_08960, partial [Coriobacteriia bacterium]|nr:hypothetical protein [Coriobacteriia bacterium]